MKKILSLAIVLAAVTLVSCGGNANKKAAAEAEAAAPAAVEACCEQTDAACAGECDSTVVCTETSETTVTEVQAE